MDSHGPIENTNVNEDPAKNNKNDTDKNIYDYSDKL